MKLATKLTCVLWFCGFLTAQVWGQHPNQTINDPGYLPVDSDGRNLNLDFETGDLTDWTATGKAFEQQPHRGDIDPNRPFASQHTSQHTGEYWIGGFEFLQDEPIGTLTSASFKVTAPYASFLIGGGAHHETRVEVIDTESGEVLFKVSGNNNEAMRPFVMNLEEHQGKKIHVRIVDEHRGGWGHVNFDDFRFYKQRPQFPPETEVMVPTPPVEDLYPFAGLPADKAAQEMRLPEGFSVIAAAAEPDVIRPIAMTIDHRGRLWIAEAREYPRRAKEGEGRDQILIFEDTNLDGNLDKRTVFAENLNLVSGLEVGYGGVWVGAPPYLLFIPDEDEDDVPDGPPQVVLDGWGYQDTHETLNSFIWGPDGWLYGCHGVFTHSHVGKPGAPDEERSPINAGIWRYHPTREKFEVFAHGTSNPWGVDFNDHGQAFLTCCVIPHLFHVIQGARYQRQAGQHFNPRTYDDIQTIARHRHFQGNQWNQADRLRSDAVGGGHAHSGAMIYLGGSWPEEYTNQLLMNNIHGARLNMDLLTPQGSGFVGDAAPDFLFARDIASQILYFRYGPDGQVWMIDWYDTQQCHNNDFNAHDQDHGRIFRVAYGDAQPVHVDLRESSDLELVELQLHKNQWYVRHARRLLLERAAQRDLQDGVKPRLLDILSTAPTTPQRLHALWLLHGLEMVDDDLIAHLLADDEPYIRAWTVQLALDRDQPLDESLIRQFTSMASDDPSPVVRLYLASAAQRIPVEDRWEMMTQLVQHAEDANDHNLPLMYWYAIEPLADVDPRRALALALIGSEYHPHLQNFMVRAIGSEDPAASLELLIEGLAEAANNDIRLTYLLGLNRALKGTRTVDPPADWLALSETLLEHPSDSIRREAELLGATFGDQTAMKRLRQSVLEVKHSVENRQFALEALLKVRPEGLPDIILGLLDQEDLQGPAIRAIASLRDPRLAKELLTRYPSLTAARKRDALSTLSSRSDFAKLLMDAIMQGDLPATDLPAEQARQIANLGNEELTAKVESLWGTVRQSPEDVQREIARYKHLLAQPADKGNVALGRALFSQTCQQCHTLFGIGGDVGPELTGSNRTDLDYILSNILDPSAVMAKEYQPYVVLTDDGRVITGLIKEETPTALTLQTSTEVVTIPRDEIEEMKQSDKSMMPDNLLANFSEAEVKALISYLGSPGQTPLLATEETAPLLFNGTDLTYWRGKEGLWSVEEGQIVGKSNGLSRNEFLISDLTAGDFHLKLEVKLVDDQGNSGIQFRSQEIEDREVKGYQADIGKGWWGKLYEEHGRGLLWDKAGDNLIRPGKWNVYEIRAEGSTIQTWINGTQAVELEDPDGRRDGVFALQLHSGGPMEIRFRNFELRPLAVDFD